MEIKRIYSEKQWNCHYIDFRIQRIAEIIKSNLINQVISRNSCLLFDAMEKLENREIGELKSLILQCNQGGAKKLKIILAGRHISKYFIRDFEFKFISLRDFDEDIVFSFIEEIWQEESKETKEKSKESEKKPVMWGDCAKYILSLGAGHPKCTEILVNESFNAYVEPQIEEILLPLGDNIRQYIELLFIFRSFNLNILIILQNKGLISGISVLALIEELKPLVHSENGVLKYSIDEIVRKLLLERMKLFEPRVYNESNHRAQLIYDELIKKPPHFYNKDKDEEIRQLKVWDGSFLQESIYHATQLLFDKKFQENDLVQCVRQSQVALAKKWCEDANSPEYRIRLKNILEDKEINETLKEQLNDYDKDQFVDQIFYTK
jgi:hypothetical protein